MTRIYRRLESLEAGFKSNQAVGRVDVYEAALEKLSPADRICVAEVRGYQADSTREPHKGAWARLDEALIETARELNVPFVLTADERMF